MRPEAGNQTTSSPGRRATAGVRSGAPRRRRLLLALLAVALLPLPACNIWEQLFLNGDPYKPILAPPPVQTTVSTPANPPTPRPTPKIEAPPTRPVAESAPARPGNPASWGDTGRLGVGREFDSIYFNGQGTELDTVATQRLASYAEWLRAHPGVFITLAGHASLDIPYRYAYDLGMARAQTAADALIGHGLEPRRIFTISYGKDLPLASGTEPPANALNNRVEVLGFVPPAGQDAPPAGEAGRPAPPAAEPPAPSRPGQELLQ